MALTSGSGGYIGKLLRVNLSSGQMSEEKIDDATLRQYPGGTCLGAKLLYEEVPPRVSWSAPENRLFFGSGPMGGTTIAGSGTFSVVTKGSLTEGATSSQANGWFGAFLKLAGFDGIIIQGAAERLAYLYIHDGVAELRDAGHLAGKDTWETEALIKEELGQTERSMSVFGIGPAGENLVRFACIVGDRGHVVAHNGTGAVMGSKKLKAIAVARGKGSSVKVNDPEGLATVAKELLKMAETAGGFDVYHWGTSQCYTFHANHGSLPVKNLTTSVFPEHAVFMGENFREVFDAKRKPCWRCPQHHCQIMKVTEGKYTGFEGEEPEYEQWASWGSQIGQTDPGAAVVLSNEGDCLGVDANESGWVVGWVMECYEKGLLTKDDLDGLEMNWGNVEGARALLRNIAYRQGFGNVLAEGVMRAAQSVGGEAANFAVYSKKGNTPRSHDHRAAWTEMLDTCVSSCGTIDAQIFVAHLFSPEAIVETVAAVNGKMHFEDSMGTCWFNVGMVDLDHKLLLKALKAATGWDIAPEEAVKVGRRAENLMRAFNIRHGLTADLDVPSPRYGSVPVDGPVKGKSVMPHWGEMLRYYYELMGWDAEKGVPLPGTLSELGIEHVAKDLWG